MGTRANIGIKHKGKLICSKYIHMDGHLENWAGDLISVLKKIKPEELNKITPLLMFMTDDNCNFSGDGEWNCEVEVIDNKYEITIYKHGEMIFIDSLEKFESEYNFM